MFFQNFRWEGVYDLYCSPKAPSYLNSNVTCCCDSTDEEREGVKKNLVWPTWLWSTQNIPFIEYNPPVENHSLNQLWGINKWKKMEGFKTPWSITTWSMAMIVINDHSFNAFLETEWHSLSHNHVSQYHCRQSWKKFLPFSFLFFLLITARIWADPNQIMKFGLGC